MTMRWLALGLAVAGFSAERASAEPAFVDRAAALPVEHVYDGGWEFFVGGGVAVLDCNDDGLPDLFVAGGENTAQLFVNVTPHPGAPITFRLADMPELAQVTGAYPLDIDGDGVLDLAVLRVGPNLLLKGGGDCRFTDASQEWGFSGGDRWSTALSATWEAGSDWPTLAIGNYVDRADPDGPFEACDDNELHRPAPEAGEGPRYGAPVLLSPGYCALSMLISDWRRAGEPELRISNDRHYYVRGGFEEMWRLSPLAPRTQDDGWPRISLWGMGIASHDITGNGLPDVMLTSMGDQLLQFNTGEGFVNAAFSIGTYAQRPFIGDDGRPSTGWHAEFGDIDNDGLADLFIAKGNVDQMPSNAMRDPNNLLMQQPDGTFVETADKAGVATLARSRGAALVDLNGDGLLDIVVVNRRAPLEIWENVTTATGKWVAIAPRQAGSNAFAVGAWVEVRSSGKVQAREVQVREVTVGGGHAGGQAMPLHFGLGAADTAQMRVTWPDGMVSEWIAIPLEESVQAWREGQRLSLCRSSFFPTPTRPERSEAISTSLSDGTDRPAPTVSPARGCRAGQASRSSR
jgi:enediyne biosynthesis protein E4